MTLRFMDGFDHYSGSQFLRKWTQQPGGGGAPSVSSSSTRFGYGQKLVTAANLGLSKTLTAQATYVVGMALNISAGGGSNTLVSFHDGVTAQVSVTVNASLQVVAKRGGGGGTTLGTSAASLASGAWQYVEVKVVFHGSAGTVTVRVDGVAVLTLTGLNTSASGAAQATAVMISADQFSGSNNGVVAGIDDVYVCDAQGGANNDFLGGVRVEALYPSGAGTTAQFTPSAGSNYQCVDESPPTDDTDYVESSTAAQKDTYAVGNMSSTPVAVYGVQTCITARKTDAGTRTVCPVLRSGGADYDQTSVNLADSYVCHTEVVEQDPDTAAAWGAAAVDGVEAGVKLVA